MPASRWCAWWTRRRGSAASRAATTTRSAALPCPATAAGWWSWRPRTTCSRALRPRRCRTSTWPSACPNSPASPRMIPLWERRKPRRIRPRTMTNLLWQKPGVEVDARIQAFLAGDDVILDREFFLFDIQASLAHAEGLQRIGILSADELDGIVRELDALSSDFRSGAFVLDERFEDGHSAIEARLVERLGDAGKRIHTGRSRNAQVLVATRLWLKERLGQVHAIAREVAAIALDRAEAEQSLPMP